MTKLLSNLIKRKTLFALVLALTIFGAVYGFAATLNVGANTLSAGNAAVASCQQTGTPTGTYTIAYDTTAAAYKISGVVVTGLDATNCAGKTVSVQLTNTAGTALVGTQMTGTVAATTLTLTPTGAAIPASTVGGVAVAING
jgi:hypothetical protein